MHVDIRHQLTWRALARPWLASHQTRLTYNIRRFVKRPLIRRASLHRAGWDDGHRYGRDICQGELDLDAALASDVRAVLDCLSTVDSSAEIEDRVLDAGELPPPHDVRAYTAMVGRGLAELRALVRDKGDLDLRRRASLP